MGEFRYGDPIFRRLGHLSDGAVVGAGLAFQIIRIRNLNEPIPDEA
jgi:hypothetical protein